MFATIRTIIFIFTLIMPCVLQAKVRSLVIFYISDINGHVEESDTSLGMAKISTYMNLEKKKYDYSMFLNAANSFYGTINASLSKGFLVRDIFNAMNLDATALGPQDFLYGVENLFSLIDKSKFKYLAANITDHRGKSLFDEVSMIQKGPFYVGVIGVTSPETNMFANPKNIKGLILTNPKQGAEPKINFLKASGANIIIALSGLGANPKISLINRSTYLATSDNLNFIIDGNNFNLEPTLLSIHNIPIFKTGKNNHVLGQLIITIDEQDNILYTVKYLYKKDLQNIIPDKKIINIIDTYKREQQKVLLQKVGTSPVQLLKPENNIKGFQTNFTNTLADSLKQDVNSDIGLIQINYINNSLKQGTLTLQDILYALPQGESNIVCTKMRGLAIKNLLEYYFANFPNNTDLIPAVSGITFEVDLKAPSYNRLYNIKVNGEAILDTKLYSIATTENIRYVNTTYPALSQKVISIHNTIQTAFVNYLQKNPNDYDNSQRIKIYENKLIKKKN